MSLMIGWDIGGAHVKAARLEGGRVVEVVQLPCELWRGLDRLDLALSQLLARWPDDVRDAAHAATMTGELADCFADRRHGVASITARLAAALGPRLRLFAAGDACWLSAQQAEAEWPRIASANWLASARWLAQQLPQALLVDVGSTTTDLVPIVAGKVAAQSRDDAARLASGELLYQGVVRTPLCSLGPRIAFIGVERNVMNELFATAADVYRLSGELDAAHDQHPAADGAGKDRVATQRRLARMIGLDAHDADDRAWASLAAAWRQKQRTLLRDNAARVAAASALAGDAPIVGAGCGDFLARALARSMLRRYRAIDELMPLEEPCRGWARVAAPCVAVALLAAQERDACGW